LASGTPAGHAAGVGFSTLNAMLAPAALHCGTAAGPPSLAAL
jgi:hypothetical protein